MKPRNIKNIKTLEGNTNKFNIQTSQMLMRELNLAFI